MTIRAEDILNRLPHRPPFLFLTDGIELSGDDSGQAVWRVIGNEPFVEGHFPGAPIVPGVLIGEALAQLSGLIVAERLDPLTTTNSTTHQTKPPIPGKLAHIDLRFSNAVAPPADIELTSRLQRLVGVLWQFDVTARSDGLRVTRGTLTLAIPQTPETPSGDAP